MSETNSTGSTDNSSSPNCTNCKTCNVVFTKENRKRNNKRRNKCVQERKEVVTKLKTKTEGTAQCTKCKYYKSIMEFLRPPMKTWIDCREIAKAKRNAKMALLVA